MKRYDAIVVGAGHNGLTNAAYLAKAGLNVVVRGKERLHRRRSGLAASCYEGLDLLQLFLRLQHDAPRAIYRSLDLNLTKHGLILVTPYLGTVQFMANGDERLFSYHDHEVAYRGDLN